MERSKILVVDDEKLVRRMIARVLESEGMSMRSAVFPLRSLGL